ncbi:NADH-ubiquinone oxidoreductase 75 kDa subunit, mitochondrial-like [Galendromus occidentalis]|uniref:NADH-ubiquinone oxidoreductase 75 kDa subunit, mitochondrial-like n=1 Tax=Galendromus occidentalis TaxID=34638 RepID=A0AAJ6QWC5_9ACAR|nr:NADH-ubiquinone oxidoreductase 75 kDa subunit, mitochondrial-like [Galendromus occidentalis]
MPVTKMWKIKTSSLSTEKVRKGVVEFLLNKHPLDIMICNQAGEGNLEQSMAFCLNRSPFTGVKYPMAKRLFEDKGFGLPVTTVMRRCIQRTRRARFASKNAAIPTLGSYARGKDIQISTYI